MKETLKLALEALRDIIEGNRIDDVGNRNDDGLTDHDGRHDFKTRIANAYEALQVGKQALAQPEQEPVAYINIEERKLEWAYKYMSWDTPTVINLPKIPFYTTPPKREWVDLTDEDVEIINGNTWDVREAARMASAKSKERNT